MTSLTIPSSISSIGDNAFTNCSFQNLTIADGAGILSLEVTRSGSNNTYAGFGTSINLHLGRTIRFVYGGNSDFTLTTSNVSLFGSTVRQVSIGTDVASIPPHAFKGSTMLTTVTIPEDVVHIGDYAFGGCTALRSVYNMSPYSQNIGTTVFNGVTLGNVNLYVPQGAETDYNNANVWKTFKQRIALTQASGITLNQTTLNLAMGSTATLTATVTPADAVNTSVAWASSNTAVATVSASGFVIAVGNGNAVISAAVEGSIAATCVVTVSPPTECSVNLDAVQAQLAVAKTRIGIVRDSVSALQTQAGTLQAQLSTAQSNNSTLQSQLSTAQSSVTTLQSELIVANASIATLTQDLNRCKAGGGTTAVAAPVASLLNVYPNPIVNGELIIDNEQLNAGDKVEIYNVNGTKVFETPLSIVHYPLSINIGHLPAGIYIVKVGTKVAKVVKQ
ncbi:hypothetical protein FACS189467_8510 [Bacteroidia bacterium]|nr:hypothetical protein FACS189467_8510 [Bacteroidia bacterium]